MHYSDQNNNQILNIAFFANDPGWIYKILKGLNQNQEKIYRNSALLELSFSISRKFSLIKTCVSNTNLEMNKINGILRRMKPGVEHCIEENKRLIFPDIHHIYNVLAYTEATLTNTKSCIDYIFKYIKLFNKNILGKKIKNVQQELQKYSIDISWMDDLDKIRNDLIHNYSAWIHFIKYNNTFKLALSLPQRLNKKGGHKKFPNNSFDTDEINTILSEFQKFFEEFKNFIVKKIKIKSN